MISVQKRFNEPLSEALQNKQIFTLIELINFGIEEALDTNSYIKSGNKFFFTICYTRLIPKTEQATGDKSKEEATAKRRVMERMWNAAKEVNEIERKMEEAAMRGIRRRRRRESESGIFCGAEKIKKSKKIKKKEKNQKKENLKKQKRRKSKRRN